MQHFHRTYRSYLKPSFNLYYSAAHGIVLLLTLAAFYLASFPKNKARLAVLSRQDSENQLTSRPIKVHFLIIPSTQPH